MRRKKIQTGDIIAIPLDDNNFGYAQFVDGDNLLGCYIVFDVMSKAYPLVENIVVKPILYMAFTSAFKIVNGEWKVIGNGKVPKNVKIPLFKVDVAHEGKIGTMVTDFKGNILRNATEQEVRTLNTMSSYTAVVIENAIRAKYGIIPWKEHYDALVYEGSN